MLEQLRAHDCVETSFFAGKPCCIALDIRSLVQKQITTWANLRNDAAHGHFAKYDQDQVKQMLLFVQKFCADYLR